jgi:hypothetical protein
MTDIPTDQQSSSTAFQHVQHLTDFPVIEFRRYTIQVSERDHFARYFETYFPEAFEQVGALIFGHFRERDNPAVFTWIRGFHDMETHATANAAFYDGPGWREHASTMNDRLIDHTNVLLLQPWKPERGIVVLPTVDPIREEAGAQGVVVAHIFAVTAGGVAAFAQHAEEAFASYRAAGAREAGVLVTLDEPNNFPRLPVREDGPYLVWLGILRDNQILEQRFRPLAEQAAQTLAATGLLRSASEVVTLDPTSRSRLRWHPTF